MEIVTDFIYFGCKITADDDCSHEIKKCLLLGRKKDQPRQHIKKQRHQFANKGPSSQNYGFSSSHVRKLNAEEWMLLNCDVEKSLESPLDCYEIKPVHPKGNQS